MLGVHAPPAVHATQLPVLQTMFAPHEVPSGLLPLAPQTIVPVLHDVVPILHMFAGWQPTFAVQAVHVPALQTMLVPQDVPAALSVLSLHTMVPVVQLVMPV